MKEAVELVEDALAVYRGTRLVTRDDITADLRAAWHRRFPPDTKMGDLIGCGWCAGMWISFGALALRSRAPRLWRTLARAGALSAVAGLISAREG